MAMARAPQPKQYCIILNTDSRNTTRNSSNQQTAIAGGIWFLDGPAGPSNDPPLIMLKSTVDNSQHIRTSSDNVKEISEQQYHFLIALKPELRLSVLASAIFSDLLKIKIYDKVTVSLVGQEQHQQCIVHYVGPVDTKRGYYFGVVFETRVGDTDGSINDKIYFVAKPKHGKFLSIDKIVNISKSKLQKLPGLSPFNSLENLTEKPGFPENTLKRRTKSQILLLDLPVAPERAHDNLDKSQQPVKKETITALKDDNNTISSGFTISSRVVFFEESGIPLHGTIRFIGPVTKSDDVIFVGIELDIRITEEEGNYKNGVKIFDCPRNKGLIARPEELIKEKDYKLLNIKDKEMMGKIIIDEAFYNAGDLDENMNIVKQEKTTTTTKSRAKSSVGEEHFSCPICLDTVDEAVETTCCHQIFCEPCIRKHREKSCPKCRKQAYTITVSHFVRKLVGNFCVECSNEGCFEIIPRSELKYHKVKCPYEIIRCPNDGCKTRVRRDKLEEHNKTCAYTLTTCPNKGCLFRVARQDIKEHDKCCDHAVVTCTNGDCNEKTKRMKLAEHQRGQCRFMMVNCPVPNCRFKEVGSKLGAHLVEEHYELFIRHLNELKDIYSKDEQVGIFTVKWMSPT